MHYESEKNRTSSSLLGFCSVMDPGCKDVRKSVESKYITVTIHQAGFYLTLCVHVISKRKSTMKQKNVEVY